MARERKLVAVSFDAQVLCRLLGMPDTAELRDISFKAKTDRVEILLSGDGLPACKIIPVIVLPTYRENCRRVKGACDEATAVVESIQQIFAGDTPTVPL